MSAAGAGGTGTSVVRKQQAVLEELADHAADAVPMPPPVMDACSALVAPALAGAGGRGDTSRCRRGGRSSSTAAR